ncbi:MAG: hypothetical protein AAGH79_03205 [Bacteroidota bacterium]
MKNLLFCTLAMILAFQLSAQDQTIFNRANRVGFFVSPFVEVGPLVDPTESSTGGGLALVLGNSFIGAYGMAGLDYEQLILDEDIERIDLAHGGLWFGYVPLQGAVIHPYASVRAGFGAVDIEVNDLEDYFDDPDFPFIDDNDFSDNVFVVAPEVGLEINITRWLRIAGAAGYRWVEGVNSAGLTNDDFTGWTGSLAVRIGWFGRNRCGRW